MKIMQYKLKDNGLKLVDKLAERQDIPDNMSKIFHCEKPWDLPGRLKLFSKKGKINWYNDSAADNMNAVFYSMQHLDNRIIWVLCNDDENINLNGMNDLLMEKVRAIVVMGKSAYKLEKIFGNRITVVEVNSIKDAHQVVKKIAREGDAVLFSPGTKNLSGGTKIKTLEEQWRKLIING